MEGERCREGAARPHINPRFSPRKGGAPPGAPRVHINPKFARRGVVSTSSLSPQLPSVAPPLPQSAPPMTHINPKFAHRPLPSLPSLPSSRPEKPARSTRPTSCYVPSSSYPSTDPSTLPPHSHPSYSVDRRMEPIYASIRAPRLELDAAKTAEYEATIRATVAAARARAVPPPHHRLQPPPSKPARPSLRPAEAVANLSPSEKENQPSAVKKANIFTPLRNSAAFKKFGSRKLVRVKSPGSTPTTSFKKIGSKKLIRISEKSVTSSSKDKNSPSYQVKTKTKIVKAVKDTPSNRNKYKFSFITPLTNRKARHLHNSAKRSGSGGKKALSSFRSRFKLDRRSKAKANPQVLFPSTSHTRLKRLSGGTYKVSATKLQKVAAPAAKPGRAKYRAKLRTVNPSLAASKVITVQGVKFSVGDNGRKLKRLPSARELPASYSASASQQSTGYSAPASVHCTPPGAGTSPAEPRPSPGQPRHQAKVYLGGEELEEVEPGVFNRSRHSLTRQSITEAKNRSINIILKNQNRSKQYCMFYNKFGKCTKKEKGSCPFLHDAEKVAVCRRFLQGACVKEACLLSHRAAPEKMPACKFFLEGVCTREACPYLHTKVSPEADICPAFLKGYCPNGSDCRQRHVMACPEFDRSGACRLASRCPFPHVDRGAQPAAPHPEKRVAPAKPKRKSLGKTPECSKKSKVAGVRYYAEGPAEVAEEPAADGGMEEMEAKRKRLLRKIELAKQGWTGVTVTAEPAAALDDSGPYERIDSAEEEARPPVGQLGDFISLAGYSSEEEEAATQHRLI